MGKSILTKCIIRGNMKPQNGGITYKKQIMGKMPNENTFSVCRLTLDQSATETTH